MLRKTRVCPGRPQWTCQVYCCMNRGYGSAMQPMLAELQVNKVTVAHSSCSWKENGSSVRQETTYIHETPKCNTACTVATPSTTPAPSPVNINPGQATPSYFRKIIFVIIAPPTFRSSTNGLLHSDFRTKTTNISQSPPIHVNNIEKFSVLLREKLRLHNKGQFVNAVKGNDR